MNHHRRVFSAWGIIVLILLASLFLALYFGKPHKPTLPSEPSQSQSAGTEEQGGHFTLPQQFYDEIAASPELLAKYIPEDFQLGLEDRLSGAELVQIFIRIVQMSNTPVPDSLSREDGTGYDIPFDDINTVLDHILIKPNMKSVTLLADYDKAEQTLFIPESELDTTEDMTSVTVKLRNMVPYSHDTPVLIFQKLGMTYHGEEVAEVEVEVSAAHQDYVYFIQFAVIDGTPKILTVTKGD